MRLANPLPAPVLMEHFCRRLRDIVVGAVALLSALAGAETPAFDATPLKPTPWEPTMPRDVTRDRLTAADWVGPDGIVYPNWTWAGVHLGMPGRRSPGIPARNDVVATLPPELAGEAHGDAFTTALQAALDRAVAAGGGVVRIPAGTFYLVRPVGVRGDRVVLRGAGRGNAAEPGGRDDPAETRLRFTFGYGPDDDGNPGPDVALFAAPLPDRLTRGTRLSVYASAFSPKASGAARQGGGKSSHIHGFFLTFRAADREPVTWAVSRDGAHRSTHTRWTSFGVSGPTDAASVAAGELADLLGVAAEIEVQATVRWRWREPDDKERTWVTDEASGPVVIFACDFADGDSGWANGTASDAIAFSAPPNPWRDRRAHLLRDARRGDTELLVSHPTVEAAEAAGLVPGAAVRIFTYVSQSFADAIERDGGSGVPRDHMATVLAVEPAEDGVLLRIEQPLHHDAPFNEGQVETWSVEKKGYVRTGDRSTWLNAVRLAHECGVEDLVLEQTRRGWSCGIAMGNMINSWVRNVRVERAGRDPLRLGGMMNEMRDCELIDARWSNNTGGGSAYLHGSTYGLIENVYGRNLRHAPNFTGHTAGVVRNSRFFSSDLQWHQNWGRAHLFENVTVDALQGTGSYGWGAFAQRSLADIHGPGMGPRNCIYNCDLIGPRGGIFLGGKSENPLILHNRVRAWNGPGMVLRYHVFNGIFLGNVFAVQNRFEPCVLFGDPERDNNRLNRTEARPNPLPHPLLGTANPGNDFIGNTLHGGSGELQAGPWQFGGAHAEWRRSFGNIVKSWDPEPPRPQPAMASVFETQRAHPQGFADRLDPATALFPPAPAVGKTEVGPPSATEATTPVVADLGPGSRLDNGKTEVGPPSATEATTPVVADLGPGSSPANGKTEVGPPSATESSTPDVADPGPGSRLDNGKTEVGPPSATEATTPVVADLGPGSSPANGKTEVGPPSATEATTPVVADPGPGSRRANGKTEVGPPSATGGAPNRIKRDDGEIVLQVNFRDKRGDRGDQDEHWRGQPAGENWWSDLGEPFGEREAEGRTARFGWVGGQPSVRQESIWSDPDFRYRTTAHWGHWNAAGEAHRHGRQDLLRPFGEWGEIEPYRAAVDLSWQAELDPGVYGVFLAAGQPRRPERFTWPDEEPMPFVQVNSFLLNDVLLEDPGQSAPGRDAYWVTVEVGEDRRLILKPAPTAIAPAVAFMQIYRRAP